MPAAPREGNSPRRRPRRDVRERHEGSMNPVLSPASRILLTGATGLIGGEILRRLDGHCARVWALVRPRDGIGPADRLTARYARSGDMAGPGTTVEAIAGDVSAPNWGLEPADR